MAWIHDIPRWLSGLLIIAVFVSLALAGLAVTRGWIRRRGLHALIDNGVVGWVFSAILSIYAITIGLTAVASWTNALDASDVASREASQIAGLFRDLEGYPQPVRDELTRRLAGYLRDVIETAWPAQRRGEIPHGGTAILDDFQRPFYAFEPTTDGQRVLHAEALRAYNNLIETRRQRLVAVSASVPKTLWSVVLLGAVIAIGASYMFSLDSIGVQAVMTGLLASMIGLLVFFIAITDMPFRGAAGIGSDSYALVLNDLVGGAARR